MDDGEAGGAPPTSTVERLGQLALLLLFLFALAGGIALLVQQGRPAGVEVTPPSIEVYVTGAVAHTGRVHARGRRPPSGTPSTALAAQVTTPISPA